MELFSKLGLIIKINEKLPLGADEPTFSLLIMCQFFVIINFVSQVLGNDVILRCSLFWFLSFIGDKLGFTGLSRFKVGKVELYLVLSFFPAFSCHKLQFKRSDTTCSSSVFSCEKKSSSRGMIGRKYLWRLYRRLGTSRLMQKLKTRIP